MVKNVLIVDDDAEMLATLENGFARYKDTFAVLTAENGAEAVEVLKKTVVSLVVTDLKMPRLDGFALLQHIMEYYPDIPVIVITGYSTPEMESMALEGGAVGYVAKPFMLDTLARKILTTLRQESEGGTLHSVSSGIFLQLIEMEQKTCTIRLEDKSSGRTGALFFRDGCLMDARVGEMQGKSAAYEIFSWDTVTISIQNVCPNIPDRVQSELQALILESSRMKDESLEIGSQVSEPKETEAVSGPRAPALRPELSVQQVHGFLEKHFSQPVGDVRPKRSWQPVLERLSEIGLRFDAGPLAACYVDRDGGSEHVMKEHFTDLLSLEGVYGVMVFSAGAEVRYADFTAANIAPPSDTDWTALVSSVARFREVDILYEKLRIYIRSSDFGHLLVVAAPSVSGAMLRLNCDIIVPALQRPEGGGKLKRFFKKSAG